MVTSLLNLVHDHRLVSVSPATVKLDATVEGGQVERGERVTHTLGLETTSCLDRLVERETSSGGLRDVVVGILLALEPLAVEAT